MDRYLEACMAAERIINAVECAGYDLSDPNAIIHDGWGGFLGDLQFAYGASRLVIWDEDYCDYVIKVALGKSFEKYCKREVEVYAAAVKEGLQDSFG